MEDRRTSPGSGSTWFTARRSLQSGADSDDTPVNAIPSTRTVATSTANSNRSAHRRSQIARWPRPIAEFLESQAFHGIQDSDRAVILGGGDGFGADANTDYYDDDSEEDSRHLDPRMFNGDYEDVSHDEMEEDADEDMEEYDEDEDADEIDHDDAHERDDGVSEHDSSMSSEPENNDDDSSNSDSDVGNFNRDRPGARGIGGSVRGHTATRSFEDLPSLALATSRSGSRTTSQSPASERYVNTPFLPKYLEESAFGMLNRHLFAKPDKTAGGAASGADSGEAAGGNSGLFSSSADCESEIARLAPDMFFKTLVRDTWPQYCTPVPTTSTFNGLRLGYGLDLAAQPRSAPAQQIPTPPLPPSRPAPTSVMVPLLAQTGNHSRDVFVPFGRNVSGSPEPSFTIERYADILARGRDSHSARLAALGGGRTRTAAGATADTSAAAQAALEEKKQTLPSEWSPVKNPLNMAVASDRVDVRYTGPGRTDGDAAMILTNNCIPMHTGVYYFEAYIKSRGQSGYIGIGLSRKHVQRSRLPGWDEGSWGYHGDDGNVFDCDGRGTPFGPGFASGDTVGCGMDFMKKRIFFTRNGVFVGYAFREIDTSKPLYPCVGMRTPGEHVVANFGRKAFMYDICHYVSEARTEALGLVQKANISCELPPANAADAEYSAQSKDPLQPRNILALRDELLGGVPLSGGSNTDTDRGDAALSIVLAQLLHNEHYATARALIENAIGQRSSCKTASDAGSQKRNERLEAVLQTLQQQDSQRATRRRVCKHIREGAIDAALGLLQDAYPAVLRNEVIVFQLRCRQFVELVRAANSDHIVASVPSDGGQLATPLGASPSHSGADDMMDVDDSHSPSLLSLSSITNAPGLMRQVRFGQLGNIDGMDQTQLVRVLLDYGRQLQADYSSSPSAIVREGLVHTFSLLAYADPAKSPVAALLDPSAREPLARLVEMAIVAAENSPHMSALECICRQTGTLLRELSAQRNGAASLLSLDRDFLRVDN
ncbi:hypothetical protein BX661DRAFT_178903 [Kickxella alabastrina]|uniref:uncharacterized protein n=1 Tax=Kickxella alabastrina TaxID=61397 RepID=UPI002220BDFF|nr:uncharacterized protein BX661DRAFT_178903 [Kickxella alabastrina]KAI7832977.1 hypothetical protein BX661DRAFT_178903 [Kickxella alabastrina]